MGTRQQRIDGEAGARASIDDITGKYANIVMKDRTVLFGEICGIAGDELLIRNMRRQKQKLALNSLSEIILDHKAG